jgi:hypothetical protein
LLPSPLPILQDLFSSNSSPVKCFHSNIRQFNAALAYTLFFYTPDPQLHSQKYTYMFQLQGAIYHWQGSLHSSNPSYSQLYFLNPTDATQVQNVNNPSLAFSDTSQFAILNHLLHSHNPFFYVFQHA